MTHVIEPAADVWTAADLVERFGAIPLNRVRHAPPPGLAREGDVAEIHDREDRLYELVDGVLVEKTVGAYESCLAMLLARLVGNFVEANDLGIVLGADGAMRLSPGLVRIPDVSFVSWQRLPGRRIPREAFWSLAPDLACEVISKGNTREEMQRKLHDYFGAGVRRVWYVYPAEREVHVFTSANDRVVLDQRQTLEGADILPGFSLPLERLFAEPGQTGEQP
ncbi:MAG: Uma2 family endonuclease [Planctomycetes bacterium]|nr:Uma2 family endonuclease [Planctomycetota bacterium]